MSLTVEATYEDGVLKPKQPLPLQEHESVRITIDTEASWAKRTQGLFRWRGDVKALDRLVLDPDLEYEQ